MTYREYLKSARWERLRDRLVRHRAFGSCELCGTRGSRGKNGNVTGLNVHHLTYERLGAEHDDDLVVLCRHCHEDLHRLPTADPLRSLKAIRLATNFGVYKALITGECVALDELNRYWRKRYGL